MFLDVETLLAALQLGDSFFPSGASSHSFGLEGMRTDGGIGDVRGVEAFLVRQLEGRWATTDRVVVLAAHGASEDLSRVGEIDERMDRSVLPAAWRMGGRRLGRALLAVHARLGTRQARAYLARVTAGAAPAQMAVVQGLVAAGCGLPAAAATALSGYGAILSVVSAALRLGLVGHLQAQELLLGQRARLAALVALPARPVEEIHAWVPTAEIAGMRHETRAGRVFAS
jgi:urease accessory protein